MKIYEVIFWGLDGNGNAEDTIYIVRASDVTDAAEEAHRVASLSASSGSSIGSADVVYEVGMDLGIYVDTRAIVLFGPIFAFAVNRGWKSWKRKTDNPIEWEEESTQPG